MGKLIAYGQAEVARWCGVNQATISEWITRYDSTPEPDVEIRTGRRVSRGWLPSRKAEWQAFAAVRASAPGAQLVAMRKGRKLGLHDTTD